MMTIKLKSAFSKAYWNIGEEFPINPDKCDMIEEVQIDGQELHHVISLFSRIYSGRTYYPTWIPIGKSVRIFGDNAKAIVANLTNKE